VEVKKKKVNQSYLLKELLWCSKIYIKFEFLT
jgi:hypothetical protein